MPTPIPLANGHEDGIDMSRIATDISNASHRLRSAAIAFSEGTDASWASQSFLGALTQIEEALRHVSATVDVFAHDFVLPVPGRDGGVANEQESHARAAERCLSHEQQAYLEATVHDLVQEFSRCAWSCARARAIVLPLIARPKSARPDHTT